jgi:hypothetical protein
MGVSGTAGARIYRDCIGYLIHPPNRCRRGTMAQTKKRPTSTRAGASKRSRSAKSKPSSTRSSNSRKARTTAGSSANGVEAVRQTVEDKAKSASQTVGKAAGKAAGKAKLPLVAGGAAIAGAAGGLALASRQSHRGGLGSALHRPKVKIKSGDVAKVAKEVGNFTTQMGALASELQRTREAAGNGRHRSPIEVALQGLTTRR